jgi:hypothetical protein
MFVYDNGGKVANIRTISVIYVTSLDGCSQLLLIYLQIPSATEAIVTLMTFLT